jgi:hypothetical protein
MASEIEETKRTFDAVLAVNLISNSVDVFYTRNTRDFRGSVFARLGPDFAARKIIKERLTQQLPEKTGGRRNREPRAV